MDVDGQPKDFGQQYMLGRGVHTFEGKCTSYKPNVAFLDIEFLECVYQTIN
jgi:hypothetical protein